MVKWNRIVDEDGDSPLLKPVQMHRMMQSGSVFWCSRCGVYADKKAKALTKACKEKPPRQRHRGGMEGQLRKLRNGTHPKTGEWLPMAIALNPDPKPMDEHKVMPEGFYTYVPVGPPPLTPSDSNVIATRWNELKVCLRNKELALKDLSCHEIPVKQKRR